MSGLMAFLEENIRYELLILIWVLYFWDLYLNLRQVSYIFVYRRMFLLHV